MKKKILLLTTGGTIASKISDDGLKPEVTGEYILKIIGGITSFYNVVLKELMLKDSTNIQPEDWQTIARSISMNAGDFDGIVITHGTDTMAYTSSALSYMLNNISIPVVLTGSQLPILHPMTDANINLQSAFAMAASGAPGVFVVFNRKVILGTRAVKTHSMGFNAFESVNSPLAGWFDATGLQLNNDIIPKKNGEFMLRDQLDSCVFLAKLIPGFDPNIFEMLRMLNYKGVVIEAFGVGGLPFKNKDVISKINLIANQGMIVVVCSQCLHESCDLSIYEVGRKALDNEFILQGMDMTTEAAVTKLMWSLGQSDDKYEIKKNFLDNIAGEICGYQQKIKQEAVLVKKGYLGIALTNFVT